MTFNCTKMRLAAGLCPDPLWELTALPRHPSWILGVGTGKGGEGWEEGKERGGKEGMEKREEGGGTGPPPIKNWLRA